MFSRVQCGGSVLRVQMGAYGCRVVVSVLKISVEDGDGCRVDGLC